MNMVFMLKLLKIILISIDEDKKFIFDQLKANFEGECSEVGMYLSVWQESHTEKVILKLVYIGKSSL